MKKIFVIVASVLFSATCMAKVSFGPVIGLNLSNLNYKFAGEKIDTKMKVGFHVGGVANLSFGNHLSVMPGILFSVKGAKYTEDETTVVGPVTTTYEDKSTLSLNYIEVPVNVVYMTGEPGTGRFMVFAGPYVAYCVSGKNKYESTTTTTTGTKTDVQTESGDDKIEIGSDEAKDQIKPLDFGFNVGVGYTLPMGVFVKAQYGMGLMNIMTGGDSDYSIKNTCFGLTAGILLGGK